MLTVINIKAQWNLSLQVAAEKDGGIAQAFQLRVTIQHKAVKGAMQCLYWLVKSEVSHTTKYGSLVDTVQYMGCDYSSITTKLKMPNTKANGPLVNFFK